MKKVLKIFFITLIFLVIAGFIFKNILLRKFLTPTPSIVPTGIQISPTGSNEKTEASVKKDIETIAENLKIPWEIAFLQDGEMLVTERPGNLLKIGKDQKVIKIDGVVQIGEGGLLGLALDPKFTENNLIYLYSTTQDSGGITNRVERYKLQGNSLTERKVVISGIKGSSNHDGGRIRFGPDGYLYITTGDAENPNLAQDKNSLNGKILRVDSEGKPAPDNPFGNAVYSYGHRNSQGLAWDDKGNLWATEHGPSGLETGNDEVNLIIKGGNYGWPKIKGDQKAPGMITPVIQSGSSDTWAPSGVIFYKGNLFFGGLRGEALYQAKIISNDRLELVANFKGQFGRIRTVSLGPEGYFYILTNNTDGRGSPKTGDDKIIKINPELFFR